MSSNINKIRSNPTINKPLSFIEGNISYLDRESIPDNIRDQIKYRALKCAPCTKAGSCTHCGCPTPKMFFAEHKLDSENKWPPHFVDEKVWDEKYKEEFLKLKEDYPDIMKSMNSLWKSKNNN